MSEQVRQAVERIARRLASARELRDQLDVLVRAATPIQSDVEANEEEIDTFSEVFQDSCRLLARLQVEEERAASPQPEDRGGVEEGQRERLREAVKERLIEDEALMKIIAAASKPYPSLLREAEAVCDAILDSLDGALDTLLTAPTQVQLSDEDRERLASDIAIWVGDELLRRAGLESSPQEFWGPEANVRNDAWLKGRDDTVAFIEDELEGHIRAALERSDLLLKLASTPTQQGRVDDVIISQLLDRDDGMLRSVVHLMTIDDRGSAEDTLRRALAPAFTPKVNQSS